MHNIYWPVFKNLEQEFLNVMFYIHFNDEQLNVYSSNITNLILRAATEIESISKELYTQCGGNKDGFIKYDDDAIKLLNQKWKLDKKVVIISSHNCYVTNKILKPFEKNETKTNSAKQTYSWNNAYQNLKHDRANSLPFGSLKYLLDIMAALFLLNIYYKDEVYDLSNNSAGSNFPSTLGSEIFAVEFHSSKGISLSSEYNKEESFDGCVYFGRPTEYSEKKGKESLRKINETASKLLHQHIGRVIPEKIKSTTETITEEKIQELVELEKSKNINTFLTQAASSEAYNMQNLKYEAILNKQQV